MKKTDKGFSPKDLADFRAMQEELLNLSREYSEQRLAAWSREMRDMEAGWTEFARDWQVNLEQMGTVAAGAFEGITAKGEAASRQLSRNWQESLAEMSAEVTAFSEHVQKTLDRAGEGWPGGGGGGWLSLFGFDLGLGGLFHKGGIVEAHGGMVISPETLLGDERLAVVQTGEGILPRDVMVRLGEENFEALRSGRFEADAGGRGVNYQVTIQVQSLDPAGVAGLDWDRVVQRHLLPALRRDLERRW
ncbi:MAG: hypothetical protein QME75_06040 [Deltaproteobacteria bacterium]|nr:hypothetical protein [Deltaproteobacteria bacterium]